MAFSTELMAHGEARRKGITILCHSTKLMILCSNSVNEKKWNFNRFNRFDDKLHYFAREA